MLTTTPVGEIKLSDFVIGGYSKQGVKEIKQVAGAMARAQGEDDSAVVLHTFQRLSLAIQRGNAAMLANSLITYINLYYKQPNLNHTVVIFIFCSLVISLYHT